jgi:hypothetical protein
MIFSIRPPKVFLLTLALLLTPSAAFAQCTGVFSPNTVCGNSGAASAPPKMTNAGDLFPAIASRAAISTSHFGSRTQITLSGYRSANDMGFGAIYSRTGATANGLMAIQDADGNWWNMLTPDQVSVGWFGAYADGGSHQISGGDIAANPQWRGTYTAGNEWDYVAVQEAMYASFANINSSPGHVSWNSVVSQGGEVFTTNKPYYVPSGNYQINHQILTVASHGRITFSGKGSAQWTWTGALATTMWLCNSCSYMQFNAPTLSNNNTESYGSAQPIWAIDWTGSIPDQLKVQQITIYDPIISVSQNGQGLALTPTNGAQGDTIAIINGIFVGLMSDYAVAITGDNALEITFTNNDIQGFQHNGVYIVGGSAQFEGTHSENEAFFQEFDIAPVFTQFTTFGADVQMPLQVTGSSPTILKGWRAEDNIIASAQGYVAFGAFGIDVIGAFAVGGDIHPYSSVASSGIQRGMVIGAGTTKPRAFMLVDNGGTQWRAVTSGASQTITDSGASYTVNQWAGYNILLRFGSNGFYYNCVIASNTATTVTWTGGGGCAAYAAGENMYQIAGTTTAGGPNFDTLANGWGNFYTGGSHGFATHAGSNCIDGSFTDFPGITTGWYIVIPNADNIAPAGSPIFPMALFGKITAIDNAHYCSGAAGSSVTIDKNAAYTLSNGVTPQVPGYVGPVIADGSQGLKWMNLAYQSVSPVNNAIDVSLPQGSLFFPQGSATRVAVPRLDWPVNFVNFSPGAGANSTALNLTNGASYSLSCSFFTPTATQDLSLYLGLCNTVQLNLNTDTTINIATMPSMLGGTTGNLDQQFTIQVTGDSTSRKLTFGTGFDSVSPVLTKTSNNVPITLVFRTNPAGTGFEEVSRSQPNNSSVTTPFSVSNSAALANVPGLSVNVAGGNSRYKIRAVLFVTSLISAGGVQAALSGTATINTIIYSGWGMDSGSTPVHGYAQATSLGTAVASSAGAWTSTNPTIIIEGEVYVGAAGTITVQFAQNTSNATASVVGNGSFIEVTPLVP